jgi:serine/threonine-protein kinase
MTGTVLGTLGYMSPEQLRGHTPTATSDIFSLGCVLYEVLTGQRPFDRLTPADTMAAVLHDDPSFDDAGASWPSTLIAITRRCLAKDGADRFRSGRDLAAALRTVVTAPAAEQQADSIAVLPFANGGGADAEHLGDGLAESLINALARIPGLRVVPRSTVFRFKGTQEDPRQIGQALQVGAVLLGRITQHGDELNVEADLVNTADGSELWGSHYARKMADLMQVQGDITDLKSLDAAAIRRYRDAGRAFLESPQFEPLPTPRSTWSPNPNTIYSPTHLLTQHSFVLRISS